MKNNELLKALETMKINHDNMSESNEYYIYEAILKLLDVNNCSLLDRMETASKMLDWKATHERNELQKWIEKEERF